MEKESFIDSNQELLLIRQMMQQSTKFISLSGLAGISVGVTALLAILGEYWAIFYSKFSYTELTYFTMTNAFLTIAMAVVLAFFFTLRKTKVTGERLFGVAAKKMLLHLSIPLFTGGIFALLMFQHGLIGLIIPICLIFYGLALINGGHYTIGSIRYLGALQIALGLTNLFFIGMGLIFFALGFGLAHIVYGSIMLYLEKKAIDE